LPVAPWLVADTPELHAIRLGMAVLRAQLAHRRRDIAVDVFDELRGRPRIAKARARGDVWIRVEQTAQGEELVRANVVRLNRFPYWVVDRRTLIARSDRVTPLVRRDEISTREAIDAGIDLLERCDGLRAETFDVVGGHERQHADANGALSATDDLDTRVVRRDRCRELDRVARVLVREILVRDGLARLFVVAPRNRHVDRSEEHT